MIVQIFIFVASLQYLAVVGMMMHHYRVTQAVEATVLTRTLNISKELRLEWNIYSNSGGHLDYCPMHF